MTAAFLPLVVLNGVLFALNIGPLYWQVLSGNSGAICMGFWVALANLNTFLNFTIWYQDALNRAPIFCDISIKIRIGAEIGRLASIFCVARFLADIVSPRATALTKSDRRRRAIFDYSIAFGVPSLVMAFHYVWQPARFAVVKGYGCNVTALMTWPTLVFRFIWPPLFAAAAVLYSVYTVYRLIRHRRNFRRAVAGSHSALTTARFVRLAILSFSYLLIAMPLAVYGTIIDLSITGRYLEYSWTYIHSPVSLKPRYEFLGQHTTFNVEASFDFDRVNSASSQYRNVVGRHRGCRILCGLRVRGGGPLALLQSKRISRQGSATHQDQELQTFIRGRKANFF
ncbi:BZ3501_MvSof-1269-A2-R1_Chr12-3g03596 [Microbotryum saponariae]|nr:BZ3501_MvSof-1269-A2-R1_Chr12-3g03596 [Microbotryum saponariae]